MMGPWIINLRFFAAMANPNGSRRLSTCSLVCMVLILTACSGMPSTIKNQKEWHRGEAAEHGSIVIGQIRWIQNGKEETLGNGLLSPSVTPWLSRQEDGWVANAEVNEQGQFAWLLDPGTYFLTKIDFRDPWSGPYTVPLGITFRVPDKFKVYYIGSLDVNFLSRRDLVGHLHGYLDTAIDDKGDAGIKNSVLRSSIERTEIQTQLMLKDPEKEYRRRLNDLDGDTLRKLALDKDQWALAMLQRASQNDDSVANFEVGLLRLLNGGALQDEHDATESWHKAEHRANVRAYIDLVVLFEGDSNLLRTNDEALPSLRNAADQGDPLAQYTLGLLCLNGLHMPQDYAQAENWFRKAAQQGFAKAQHRLGILYYYGLQSDPYKVLRVAPSMAISFANNDPLLIDFNQLNTSSNIKEAEAWMRKAANQGNAAAQNSIGLMYERGEGVSKDPSEAAVWYRLAATQGLDFGEYNLARLYELGLGVKKCLPVALAIYGLSSSNKVNALKLADELNKTDLDAAEKLAVDMSKPGGLPEAIDWFLVKTDASKK